MTVSPWNKLLAGVALVALGVIPILVGVGVAERAPMPLPRGAIVAGAVAGVLMVGGAGLASQRRRGTRAACSAGLLAVAAVVCVQRWVARLETQEKSVALPRIRTAAEQFFLEHPGRIFVRYDELVGPNRYIKSDADWHQDYRREFPARADLREFGVTMETGHRVILFSDEEGNYEAFVRHLRDGRIANIGSDSVLAEGAERYRRWLAARPRHGVEVRVLRDGRKFETTYRDGIAHGPFRAFYPDGKLWGEATYVNGRPAGRHVAYDRGGAVQHEMNF